jgi:hypothetical protein
MEKRAGKITNGSMTPPVKDLGRRGSSRGGRLDSAGGAGQEAALNQKPEPATQQVFAGPSPRERRSCYPPLEDSGNQVSGGSEIVWRTTLAFALQENLIQGHAAPNISGHVEVLTMVDRRLALFKTAT